MTVVMLRLISMIESFRHRGLKWLFNRGAARKIAPEHHRKVADILTTLEAAQDIEDMNLATFHLHQLTGDQAGIFSVTVRANWRITFTFENGKANNVNYEDYH